MPSSLHGGLSAFFNNEAEQILVPSACSSQGHRRSSAAAVLGHLPEAPVPGGRRPFRAHTEFLQTGGTLARPSRAHAEFLQTADALTVGPHLTVKHSAVAFFDRAGAHKKSSEAGVALERGEIAQQIAEEARTAAEHAEDADRGLEQVEHAVLWFNFILTGVLFAGVWVTHRGYTQWLERKKELGRAWQAVQNAGMAPGYAPTAGNWPEAPDSASVAADVSAPGSSNAGPAPLVQLPPSVATATPSGASASASVPGVSPAAASDAAPASPPAPSADAAPGTASTNDY